LERLGKGLELVILGYFFKVIIADNCAVLSNSVYANPAAASVLSTYVGVLGFAVQLYFDFLGYTHIARGSSLLFNLKLPINFNHPFHSANMADFWQRWQISLSRWLHDYLFVPLGGSRKSLLRTLFNIFITLLVAGIWHGAGWTYVSLGVFFGLTVGGYHAWRRLRKKLFKSKDSAIINHPVYAFTAQKLTATVAILCGIFFRAPDLQTGQLVFQRLLEFPQLIAQLKFAIGTNHYLDIGVFVGMLVILQFGPWAARQYERVFVPLPYWMKLQTATAVALLCWIYCAEYTPPFIYFQF
jgi:alginate O-acetyltransferase complex protein AlgI